MDDFNAFLMTPIVDPLDPHRTAELISQPPFVLVPGVANIRDIGGLPIKNSDSNGQRVVRKGRMYRAATLNHITPEGKEALRALDIGAIYDLRTLGEVRRYAKVSPDDLDPRAGLVNLTKEGEIEGEDVKVYHVPLVELSREDPKAQFSKLLKYGRGDQGFLEGYEEILESAGESYGTILRYIMSQSKEGGKACLWHCHAGKDRTGVFAALVLELLGVPDEAIARDYALTRVGLEPSREALVEQFKDLIASHPDVANGMASSNASLMILFLNLLRSKYGGGRGYFKAMSGFTDEELNSFCAAMTMDN